MSIVAPTLSREMCLVFSRELPSDVLEFVQSTIREIVEHRHGEQMLETGGLIHADPFSYTRGGDPFVGFEYGSQLVYALVHNDAHKNVAFMFGEDERRIPADDTLTVVRGHFGSYPNFFFEVDVANAGPFVDALLGVASDADLALLVGVDEQEHRLQNSADKTRT